MSVDVLRPNAIPVPAPLRAREHHWEGDFTGTSGFLEKHSLHLKASLGLHGELIEGLGRMTQFGEKIRTTHSECTITGTFLRTGLNFEIWCSQGKITRNPFRCDGAMNQEENEARGEWSLGCLDPVECGCAGASGAFVLRRIE